MDNEEVPEEQPQKVNNCSREINEVMFEEQENFKHKLNNSSHRRFSVSSPSFDATRQTRIGTMVKERMTHKKCNTG